MTCAVRLPSLDFETMKPVPTESSFKLDDYELSFASHQR
jgi:hypothetical protein